MRVCLFTPSGGGIVRGGRVPLPRGAGTLTSPAGEFSTKPSAALTAGGGGAFASILASLANGVVAKDASGGAPNTAAAALRNLRANGAGDGLNGVRFPSGMELRFDDLHIFGFTSLGINVNMMAPGQLRVSDRVVSITTADAAGGGYGSHTSSPTAEATLINNRISSHPTGVNAAAGRRAPRRRRHPRQLDRRPCRGLGPRLE